MCRSDAANPLLESAFIGCVSFLVCKATPLLVSFGSDDTWYFLNVFHPKCFSHSIFGHAEHAHSVRRWCWSAAVCSTGGGCQSRVAPCTDGTSFAPRGHVSGHVVLGGLPDPATGERLGQLIDATDRSVEELGPDPPAWWPHMTYNHIFHQFGFCDISPSHFLTLLTHTDQSEKITYSSCPDQQ